MSKYQFAQNTICYIRVKRMKAEKNVNSVKRLNRKIKIKQYVQILGYFPLKLRLQILRRLSL